MHSTHLLMSEIMHDNKNFMSKIANLKKISIVPLIWAER